MATSLQLDLSGYCYPTRQVSRSKCPSLPISNQLPPGDELINSVLEFMTSEGSEHSEGDDSETPSPYLKETESERAWGSDQLQQVENCIKWLFSDNRSLTELTELLKYKRCGRGTPKIDDRKICSVFELFAATLRRHYDSHKAWSWNRFVTIKVLATVLICAFPDDVSIFNICVKVLAAVRQDIESSVTMSSKPVASPDQSHLDLLDDIENRELSFLCGIQPHMETPSICTHPDQSDVCTPETTLTYTQLLCFKDPEAVTFHDLDRDILARKATESINDLKEQTSSQWRNDVNHPATEALEQQSRTVLVYGEPYDGVLYIVRSVLKRRRANSQKMTIIVVHNDSEPSNSFVDTITECIELIGRNSHRVDASLVMIPFSGIGNVMAIVDRVVIGVKQCFSDGSALAFDGTKAICIVAKQYNKTVVLVTTLLGVAPIDSNTFQRFKWQDQEGELIDGTDVSFFVTPIGMFPPNAVIHEVERYIHSRDRDLVELYLRLTSQQGVIAHRRLCSLDDVEVTVGLDTWQETEFETEELL